MTAAFIVAARRTAVMPRHGAFARIEAAELAAAAIRALLADSGLAAAEVDDAILGNALSGGGNPARLAALLAGLPQDCPATTLDSQCCSGLDAVMQAAALVESGAAGTVIAGGLESYSRSPIRMRRPKEPGEVPRAYERPPFTPWPDRDPEMIAAASALARELGIPRAVQEAFAVASHARALAAPPRGTEIVSVAGRDRDGFTRRLTPGLCRRLPPLPGGDGTFGCTTATVAVEADAAAAVLVVSERRLSALRAPGRPLRILGGARRGGDPERPALAPVAAARTALARCALAADALAVSEVMEAFAIQAIACIDGIGLDPRGVNRGGGALARGHPIGASGAVLAVRLWHEMQGEAAGARGLATIAAAGGLGSALILEA